MLFKSESGADSEAQITAFEDTWHWGETAEATYDDIIVNAPHKVATAIEALTELDRAQPDDGVFGDDDGAAGGAAPGLEADGQLVPALRPDRESLFEDHVLDAIFGTENFRNEIVWKRQRPPTVIVHSRRSSYGQNS